LPVCVCVCVCVSMCVCVCACVCVGVRVYVCVRVFFASNDPLRAWVLRASTMLSMRTKDHMMAIKTTSWHHDPKRANNDHKMAIKTTSWHHESKVYSSHYSAYTHLPNR